MKSSATGLEAGKAAKPADLARHDEESLLEMMETLEQRHGYVPRDISEEVARLVDVKLERLRRLRDGGARLVFGHEPDGWDAVLARYS